jgi:predicted RNA-binding Zn-ribbon protein involved in translation (DUF1610 family)
MNTKEKFCKYSKHPCPDCGEKLKIMDIISDNSGVSYTERCEVCEECGYQKNITNKRNNNNKIEIDEVNDGKSKTNNERRDASRGSWK